MCFQLVRDRDGRTRAQRSGDLGRVLIKVLAMFAFWRKADIEI
jgi:hypothetical protein